MLKNLKLKIGLLVVFVVFVVFPNQARAEGLDLGIYPPVLKIEAQSPASIKTPIIIQNYGEETVELEIVFKPFTAGPNENGEVSYFSQDNSPSFADPLIFQRMQVLDNDRTINTVILAPGQEKSLTLHIGIPKDEPLSDYYFSIAFVASQGQALRGWEESNGSRTSGGIATNVLLSIGPKGKANAVIEEFSAPLFIEKGPVPFTLRVKNTSERVITPTGGILIKNMFGQTIGNVELLPVNILAGTIRAIPDLFQSPDATPSATFNFQLSTFNSVKTFWREGFLLGPYTATLTLSASDQGPILKKTVYFFALPAQLFIGIIIAALIILLIKNRLKAKIRENV